MRKTTVFFLLLFCFCIAGVLAQSNTTLDSLSFILKTWKDDTAKVNKLNTLVAAFRYSNVDTAIYFVSNSLRIATRLNYEMGIADSKVRMSALCASSGRFNEGIEFSNDALALYEKLFRGATGPDKKMILRKMGTGYGILGHNWTSQGNYPEALRNTLLSLKIREELEDKRGIGDMEYNIGNIYYDQKNYPEALKHHYASLQISREIGTRSDVADDYNTIGLVYFAQGNYDEALRIYSIALKLAEESKSKYVLAQVYENLGVINEQQRNFNEALKYDFAALKFFDEVGIEEEIPSIYNHIASVYTKQKKYLAASEYLDKALFILKKSGSLEFTRLSYYNLATLDSAKEDYKTALEHYKLAVIYGDSLLNQEKTKRTVQQQMQYEFDKKEDSLRQKQLVTDTKLRVQKKQRYFYWGVLVMLGALSFFVFLNFHNQKKVNRLMDDAHAKEKAELELQSLRAQLNPHFMFNSLNAIQELILKEENEKSQSYLARFAKLLRMLLENAEKPFIPLQREIDFLKLYLSLENLRVPDLQYSINIDPDIDTEQTNIPNMILQPYIENAIWHGLSHKQGNRELQGRISKGNGFTKYEIEDNGVGRKKAAELKSLYRKEHKSKGMELLNRRFKLLAKEYGSDIETDITDVVSNGRIKGTIVTIKVPVEPFIKKEKAIE
jgi:tetratricopeptide (TPR) repeat protein